MENPNSSDYIKEKIEAKERQPCYIATATYGTPHAKEIDILRAFRDDTLLNYSAGRNFIQMYYKLSPALARQIAKSNLLRSLSRHLLIAPILRLIKLAKSKNI